MPSTSLHPTGLGGTTRCGGANVCDPWCRVTQDDAIGLDAGAGFVAQDGGLTVEGSPLSTSCTSLAITGSASAVSFTSLSPIVRSPDTVSFTAALLPTGCFNGPFPVVWSVDSPDSAGMTGTTNSDGQLTVVDAVARTIRVSAFADGKLAFKDIVVSVQAAQTGSGVTPAQSAALDAGPEVTDALTVLYPYDQVVLPLGLLPPTIQWSPALSGSAVRVGLKYTGPGASFSWTNTVTEPTGPRLDVPASIWDAFERTARGATGQITLRRTSGANRTSERVVNVRFATEKLKGTVYYGSYTSKIASVSNSSTGAILAIKPGQSQPDVAIAARKGKCHVCHTVSADGTRLATQDTSYNGTYYSASVWNMSASGATLSGSYVGTTDGAVSERYNWGGQYPDGSFTMSHNTLYNGDKTASRLTRMDQQQDIALSGWPSNIQARTPAFSPDGRKLAFNFYSGSAIGSVSSGATRSLVVTDFACGALPGSVTCGTGAYSVSNARQLVMVESGAAVAWPAFLPDSSGVVYQKAVRPWSHAFTRMGSQSELWLVNTSGTAQPTRLDKANGVGNAPEVAPYHTSGASVYYESASSTCGATLTQQEAALNYMPTVNPASTGGYHWVVFTSRRLYGNLLTDGSWACNGTSLNSRKQKKLWVAAVDANWTPGTDPSHPAFYLPGQELAADAERGFWALSPCTPAGTGAGNACDTDDDCCGGRSSPKTAQCRIDVGSNPITRHCASVSTRCAAVGESCSVAADCCTAGAVCNVGQCALPRVYSPATFTRDFQANCEPGFKLSWRNFDWQASVPAGTSIGFRAQTADSAAALPGAASYGIGKADVTTTTWMSTAKTVDQILRDNGDQSRPFLRISMDFNPTTLAAPVMTNWRQLFSCVPYE